MTSVTAKSPCRTKDEIEGAIRVAVEPLAYEGYIRGIWPLLPISAIIEMAAFTPEHIRIHKNAPEGSAYLMSNGELEARCLEA